MDPPKPAPRRRLPDTTSTRPKPKTSPKKIHVRNIARTSSKDSLTLYFESKRNFRRELSVEEVDYEQGKGEAVITFKHVEDAEIVLDTSKALDLTLDGCALEIEVFGEEETPQASGENQRFSVVAGSNDDEEEDDDGDRTVEVTGFNDKTTQDALWYYFCNHRKGGGDIESMDINREDMRALITFKDKRVLSTLLRRDHSLENVNLKVRWFTYSKTDLLLTGLTDDISDETLSLFIEAKLTPDFRLTTNEERTKALIQSNKPIDFGKAVETCKKKPVEGVYLTVSHVPVTNCLIVTGIPDTTEDTFKFYFENPKCGGSGSDVTAELHKDEGYCLIFFSNTADVSRVCRHSPHIVSKKSVTVSPYHTCLGLPATSDGDAKFSLPENVDLSKEDNNKLKFLNSNDVQRQTINSLLEDHYARLSFRENLLVCTLTKSDKGCKKLAKTWRENALGALQSYLRDIDVRVRPIALDARKQILAALEEVDISDPDQMAVFFPKDSKSIVVVGLEDEVKNAWSVMDKVITETESQIKESKLQVSESKNLKVPWKVLYLKNQFLDKMKRNFPNLEIHLNEKKAEVNFKGRKEEVTQAELEMFEVLQYVHETQKKLGKEKVNLLCKQEVKQRINKQLEQRNAECLWDVIGEDLLLYGEDYRDISPVLDTIEDFLTTISMPLDNTKTEIIKSPKWQDMERNLLSECEDCIDIKLNSRKNVLEVYTIEDFESVISDKLDSFFQKNAVYEETFKCEPNVRNFIISHKQSECKGQPDAKAIEIRQDNISLKGTRSEIEAGKRLLNNIKSSISSKEDVLTRPGIHSYFTSEEGTSCIQRTEKSIPCIIEMHGRSKNPMHSKDIGQGNATIPNFAKPTKCAESQLGQGCVIEVWGGDMTEIKVDVIVNASNQKLEHAGGLAAAIVRKGGQVIQDECFDRVKAKGQLSEGDVFMSGAGKLSCKAITHALGPFWKGGNKHEEENLKKAINKCLQKTEKKSFTSIAIPALSTGAFHYPADKACSAIVEQVIKYFQAQTSSHIKKVVLCDINEKTVRCFINALKGNTRDVKVHYTLDSASRGRPWLHTEDTSRQRVDSSPWSPDRDQNGGTHVEVVQAELSKQRVDVIVNSTSKGLQLEQGLASKAISRAAGKGMQRECDSKYRDGIRVGEIAVTGGYNLNCKKVYHIAVDSYEKENARDSLDSISAVVKNCLQEANKHGATSIAFPPIGCGAQRYPVKEVAATMVRCITKFLEKTPNTSIADIKIVIYTADSDKYQVFKRECRHFQTRSPPHSSPGRRRSTQHFGQVVNISRDSAQFRLDCIDVNISQGDITEEDADAIVASCNLDLDLTKGAVTKALLKKGGDEIKKECEKQKPTMKRDGIVITKAGKLKAGFIIHLDVKYKARDWLLPVEKCLKMAEDQGLHSIAFPTLGISVGCSPEGIANIMHEAITNFVKNNVVKNLQEVRIIVFQSHIVKTFIGAIKDAIEGPGETGHATGGGRGHSRDERSGGRSHQSDDKVTFKVYAEGDENVKKALYQLKKSVTDEWMVQDMKDTVLFTLPQKKIDEIKREGQSNNVNIKYDNDLGEIKLHGLAKNMMPVKDRINQILRSHEKSKHEHQQAKLLANIVRWFYLKDQKQFPFPDDWNKKVEEAYQRKDKTVKVKDRSGGEYEIDFTSMEEKDLKSSKKFTILRRDIVADSSKELPKTWKPMADNENLVLVTLQTSDKEYKDVEKEFINTLGRTPNIIKIERIQNQALYTQYIAKRKQMSQQNSRKDNERVLWHGTAADAVKSINAHGFNRSYCGKNAVAIGNGVYFAVNTSYSDQPTYSPADASGHKRMYRCLVLTGDYCLGQGGLRVPPPKAGGQSHVLYDSVTNNVNSPMMFVIFHDCQAYPEHIITYT